MTDQNTTPTIPTPVDKKHWEALFRGSVLSTQATNMISYVTIADHKAQVMLFLNSLVIPFIVPGLDKPGFGLASLIALTTAFITIFLAIMAVMPRGASRFSQVDRPNLLHFANIKRFKSFEHYLNAIHPIYNDPQKLGQESLKFIYDTSMYILRGKYYWLRLCYSTFLVGNFIALVVLIISQYSTF